MTGLPRRLRVVLAVIIAATAVMIAASPALANGLSLIFPDPVSPNGQRIYDLYVRITYPAIVIFVGVELTLLYIILRFRRKHPAQVGASWHGNTPLEIIWTVIPVLIVAYIAFVSYTVLVQDFTTEAANANTDMNVAVNGVQFSWSYTYDEGFTVQNEMVVPAGKMVHMTFDSDNVIHSWWVPALTGKTDAVPGYTNQSWIKVDPSVLTNCPVGNDRHPDQATGGCVFHGECAELCGAGHATMQIDVLVVSQSEFDSWVAAQKAKATAPSPSPKPSGSPSASPSPSASQPSASPSAKPSP
ncbi:MAG: cytochrome c oxidase subunit II [Candidatus Dormibacteraeota bacterium]|nr:cytochrome c oxidase subunit II [Candidatus Dormibacteraeota bacterium]